MLDLLSDCQSSEERYNLRFCVYPKIRPCFREYTGISRQTIAGASIIGAIMIAKTVLAALDGSSC